MLYKIVIILFILRKAKVGERNLRNGITKLSGWPRVKLCSWYKCSDILNLFPFSLSGQKRQSIFILSHSRSSCKRDLLVQNCSLAEIPRTKFWGVSVITCKLKLTLKKCKPPFREKTSPNQDLKLGTCVLWGVKQKPYHLNRPATTMQWKCAQGQTLVAS